jgi:hypothetical protein
MEWISEWVGDLRDGLCGLLSYQCLNYLLCITHCSYIMLPVYIALCSVYNNSAITFMLCTPALHSHSKTTAKIH